MLNLFYRFLGSESDRACFFRFASVGMTIATIDSAVLYLLMGFFQLDPYLGRAISLFAAMTTGYFLNRHFTFRHREHGRVLLHAMVRFYSVHSTGAAINIGVYALVLEIGQYLGGTVAVSGTLPLIGVIIGGVSGMCWNFFFSNKLVFEGRSAD